MPPQKGGILGDEMTGTVISYPIPAYANVPINAQYYEPSQFIISALTLGNPTLVTTSVNHNYVVGQLVRLLIPAPYGTSQLDELSGYVLSIPSANQLQVSINSNQAGTFIPTPFTANIIGATQASQCVLTTSQSVFGTSVFIQNVGGMTQLNGNVYSIIAQTATSITINVDSTGFTLYTSGGTATVYPINGSIAQIVAIGDVNSGATNSSGRNNNITFIPGSFINISPI